MSTRLYVGNIPYRLSAEELSTLVARVTRVESVHLPVDRETGRPRGFGFVEIADDADAERVIRELDGQPVLGRPLVVHPARPREVHPARPRDGHPSHDPSRGRGRQRR